MSLQTAESRRSRQRDEARRAILDGAEALLAEAGYEGFSIRRLTALCGYTAPTIYHHFGDKPGLLDAVLQRRFEELLRMLRRVPAERDPLETIRAQARAFLRFGRRHPTHYRMLTIARDPDAAPLPAVEDVRALFTAPWEALAAEGRLRVDEIQTAQRTLWALMHGLLTLRASRPDLEWPSELPDQAIDATLAGLVASPARTAPHDADVRAAGAR